MNNTRLTILVIFIFAVAIIISMLFSCAPQTRTLEYHKTLTGYNVHKLKVSQKRADEINSQVRENNYEYLHYENDTLYITYYDYVSNSKLFENGLLKNRELKRLQPKKLIYEWDEK